MKIAILTSLLFQECSEITGKDRIYGAGRRCICISYVSSFKA